MHKAFARDHQTGSNWTLISVHNLKTTTPICIVLIRLVRAIVELLFDVMFNSGATEKFVLPVFQKAVSFHAKAFQSKFFTTVINTICKSIKTYFCVLLCVTESDNITLCHSHIGQASTAFDWNCFKYCTNATRLETVSSITTYSVFSCTGPTRCYGASDSRSSGHCTGLCSTLLWERYSQVSTC